MCGIAGIISLNGENIENYESISRDFVHSLNKRGPDSNGLFYDNGVLLTHTRLSIIDLSEKAAQPMISTNKRYVIVFNGEIFNFKKLKRELEEKGHVFNSESDTEVVLELYQEYGVECLKKLNGFFSFAIYDKVENTLFFARDRIGIKPFYYYLDNDIFVFASEIKALLKAIPPQEIDFDVLGLYLQLTYIPPPFTIFKNVKKLKPAYYGIIKNGKVQFVQYYKPEFNVENQEKKEDLRKELFHLFETSVQEQLISDVPIGCFLSGGIDSSIIVALASRHINGLQTYSIGFPEEPYYNESKYAELVARQYKTEHTTFNITNSVLYESVFEMLNYIDEPYADSSSLAFYVLCKETRKNVKVVLSGDGADELFGGYNKYKAFVKAQNTNEVLKIFLILVNFLLSPFPKSRQNKVTDLIRKISKFTEILKKSGTDLYWYLTTFNPPEQVNNLLNFGHSAEKLKEELLKEFDLNLLDVNKVMYLDLHIVLPGDMLTKVDMMSMANSLEVRPPFLSNSIVEYALKLPDRYKINAKTNKIILRETFADLLPDEIKNRKKHGFEVPLDKWFKNEMRAHIVNDLFSSSFINEQKIFNYASIQKLLNVTLNKKYHNLHFLMWSLIVFQSWYKNNQEYIKQ